MLGISIISVFVFNLIRYRKNCHCGLKHVLFVLISERKVGDQNFPCLCVSLRRKNLLTHFGHHIFPSGDSKKFQSPVGACLKKLILDPESMGIFSNRIVAT